VTLQLASSAWRAPFASALHAVAAHFTGIVHLDRVSGLGDFLELEVVLEDGESADVGVREAERLMARLGVEPSQLVEGAYVDLLTTS
jgi:adenylate cyclase class IV